MGICLVGTIHTDLYGESRLNRAIDKLSPTILALELSPEGASRFEKEMDCTKLDNQIDGLNLELTPKQKETYLEVSKKCSAAIGFEYRAIKSHARVHPEVQVEYIDLPLANGDWNNADAARMVFKMEAQKLLTEEPGVAEGIKSVLDMGVEEYVARVQAEVEESYPRWRLYERLTPLVQKPGLLDKLYQILPGDSVDEIKRVLNPERDEHMAKRIRELSAQGTIIAVVGLAHLSILEKKLKDLNPKAIPLSQYSLL